MDTNELIRSQIKFYDSIAATFAKEHAEVGSIGDLVLSHVKPARSILELASGAGRWTEKLCERAEQVVAVDSSPNLINLSRARLVGKPVEHIRADIFSWPDLGTYDAVFFAFWLSHVPEDLFDDFWNYVRSSLRPMGQVVFVDSLWSGPGGGGDRRQTPDGQTFQIVKVPYVLDELGERLETKGFSPEIKSLSDNIYMGILHVRNED